jgi:hypothetical protein
MTGLQVEINTWLKNPNSGFRYISLDEFESIRDNPKILGLDWMLNISHSPRYKNAK